VQAQYYEKTTIANMLFYMAFVMNVVVLIWGSQIDPFYVNISMVQILLLIGGRMFYPKSRIGQYESNLRLHDSLGVLAPSMLTCGALLLSQVFFFIFLGQGYTLMNFANTDGVLSLLFGITAAISESYFLHWGLQSMLSAYTHPYIGIIGVPIVAVLLHMMVYGKTGVALILTFIAFAILAFSYYKTRKLDVPTLGHTFLNIIASIGVM
jgi:membrane protease YdiL (CAAX protease family)